MSSGSSPSPRPRHYLEWLALKGALGWLRRGELAVAVKRTHRLADWARHLLQSEWRWANLNLQLIYGPHLTPGQRERLAALAFRHQFTSYLDGIRNDEIQVTLDAGGEQRLREAYGKGRGVIICSAHLGSWEAGLRHLHRLGYPAAVVYRHANNPLADREINAARHQYGVALIPRKNPRAVIAALKEKKVLVLMSDINTRRGGIAAPFLGLPALCPPGPAQLAARFRCPVLPVVTVREGDAGHCRALVGEPIPPPEENDPAAFSAFIQRVNLALEPWVHQFAEQYNWLHARWRSRPDGALWRNRDDPERLARARVAPFAPLHPRVAALLGEG